MQADNINQEPSVIHVAIVEDDSGFLHALGEVLRTTADMRLTGAAVTRAEGLALLDGPPSDVLLVDLGLPDGSGIDVIQAAARQWTACSIMVTTNFGDEQHVMRSIEAGAAGYLLKDSSPARIVDEIRSVATGGSSISPIIARQILARLRQDGKPDAAPASLLSAREMEVLDLITKGFKTQEIATLMNLSPVTVRTLVRRIYSKV
ncbi:response regulator transcription factor [Trinickia sp. YCB016]